MKNEYIQYMRQGRVNGHYTATWQRERADKIDELNRQEKMTRFFCALFGAVMTISMVAAVAIFLALV